MDAGEGEGARRATGGRMEDGGAGDLSSPNPNQARLVLRGDEGAELVPHLVMIGIGLGLGLGIGIGIG